MLNQRITDRVGNMVSNGIEEEISQFYRQYKQSKYESATLADPPGEDKETVQSRVQDKFSRDNNTGQKETKFYEEGLFQAIGFKEFHSYFTYSGDDEMKSEKLLQESLESLKRVTIKYSKKQRTWLRNRFLSRPIGSAPNVYKLDATDVTCWNGDVLNRASRIASAFLKNDEIPFLPEPRITAESRDNPHRKYVCVVCSDRIIMGDLAWEKHLTSRTHKKLKCKMGAE